MRPPIQLSAETPDGQIRLVRFGDTIRLQLDMKGQIQNHAVSPETLRTTLESGCDLEIETVSTVSRTLLKALVLKLPASEFHGTEPFVLPEPITANETRSWQVRQSGVTIEPSQVSHVVMAPLARESALAEACEIIVTQIISARTSAIRNLYRQLRLDLAEAEWQEAPNVISARIAG